MLVNAKALADMDNQKIRVQWRGYHCSVHPHEPPFTKKDLRLKLAAALQNISLPTEEEREVFFESRPSNELHLIFF